MLDAITIPWIAAAAYACLLFAASAYPFRYIGTGKDAAAGGVLAVVLVWLFGFVWFARQLEVSFAPNSVANFGLQALVEELARGFLLYVVVFKRGGSPDALFQRSMLFGCAFGWGEFLLRSYAIAKSGTCAEMVRPLSCADGIPLIGTGSAEVILFHIFITALNYRNACTPARLAFAIATGTVIHTALNSLKFLPAHTADIDVVYLVIPTIYVAVFATSFLIVVRRERLSLLLSGT